MFSSEEQRVSQNRDRSTYLNEALWSRGRGFLTGNAIPMSVGFKLRKTGRSSRIAIHLIRVQGGSVQHSSQGCWSTFHTSPFWDPLPLQGQPALVYPAPTYQFPSRKRARELLRPGHTTLRIGPEETISNYRSLAFGAPTFAPPCVLGPIKSL